MTPSTTTASALRHKNASALILVLWAIALLSVIISGFAFDMHIESRILSLLRKKLKAQYLAKAGIEEARMLLIRSARIKGTTDSEEDKGKPWYSMAKRLKQGYAIVGFTDHLDAGTIVLDIVPEPARRNVNRLKDEDWELIFTVGGVPEERWGQMIDSFNDWRDGDDTPNLNGAETDDYYARLDPPYKAKGRKGKPATVDTVEELLLIRGFDRAVLYGGAVSETDTNGASMSGIADLLTALPESDAQVNVNAASKRVLMTLPGIDEVKADAIMAEREGLTVGKEIKEDAFFTDANSLFARVPELASLTPEDRTRLGTLIGVSSRVLRITSRGCVQGVEEKIVSIVKIE